MAGASDFDLYTCVGVWHLLTQSVDDMSELIIQVSFLKMAYRLAFKLRGVIPSAILCREMMASMMAASRNRPPDRWVGMITFK